MEKHSKRNITFSWRSNKLNFEIDKEFQYSRLKKYKRQQYIFVIDSHALIQNYFFKNIS